MTDLDNLHTKLQAHLARQDKEWDHFIYSKQDGFYQGLDEIKIIGSRSSEKRFEEYEILEHLSKNKTILEIGSGYGDLTKNIVAMGPKKIFAIEKDKKLSFLLKKKFQNYKNIKIINGDILNIIQENNLEDNVTIFGNLPYNISTKILASLIMLKKWPPWYHVLILMFQKEVADRIIAKTRTKEFGRLSILANWRLEIKKHFDISKNCFFPKPKINSTLLSFKPKKINTFNLKNPKNLEIVTRILFSNRRKMINKNLKGQRN